MATTEADTGITGERGDEEGMCAMIMRIFLADDHVVVRDVVQSLLNSQPDMQVVGMAANGRDAVRMVAKLRPDVAVMDITMPELNGIDATEQIRRRSPLTKVVMFSMHSDPLYVFRALKAGASGYITKESGGTELVAAVRAVHNGEMHLSPPLAEDLLDNYVLQNRPMGTG